MPLIEKIVNWAVPFVMGAVVSGITLWVCGFRAFRNGLQCLLRAEVIRQNEKWMALGYCPIYAKQALSRVYAAYRALKGNDVATVLYNEVMQLQEAIRNEENHN